MITAEQWKKLYIDALIEYDDNCVINASMIIRSIAMNCAKMLLN